MKVSNYATSKTGTKHSVIAVACENCNHIMVLKTGRSITAFKSLAALAREHIPQCPACGAKVAIREKQSVFGSLLVHPEPAEELNHKLQALWEEDLAKDLNTLIDKVKKPEDLPPDNPAAAEIRSDITKTKHYLDTLIRLETSTRLLLTRVITLSIRSRDERAKAAEAVLDAVTKNRRANTVAENKIAALNAEIDRLEAEFAAKDWAKAARARKVPLPKVPEYLDTTPPAEPAYPSLKKPDENGVYPHEPSAPPLKTPGLFNKKKVQEENAVLMARHRQVVADYRQACEQENAKLLDRYAGAMEAWQQACAALEERKRKNEAMKAEYEAKLEKHRASAAQRQEKALAEAEVQKAQARAELDEKIAALRQQIEEISGSTDTPRIQLQISQLFDVQIAAAKKQLQAIVAEKNRLYSINVVYPTYRELVALSSFYEYFNSGRCDALEGPHGAYNLFEAECRSDVAARVIRTIEEIKQGQVILHRQMAQIESIKKDLAEALDKALPHIRKISAEKMASYLEENRAKGAAAAEKETPEAKESAVARYFRLSAACELRVEKDIAEAKATHTK